MKTQKSGAAPTQPTNPREALEQAFNEILEVGDEF